MLKDRYFATFGSSLPVNRTDTAQTRSSVAGVSKAAGQLPPKWPMA